MTDVDINSKVEALVQMVALYTEQIAHYEDFSYNYVMTCFGFVGVIIGVVIGLMSIEKNSRIKALANELISVITLLIPIVLIMSLYSFSVSLRKVYMFRGYLSSLEDTLNEMTESNYFLFDNVFIDSYMDHNFLTTSPILTLSIGIFYTSIIVVCFFVSFYFAKKAKIQSFFNWYQPLFMLIVALCVMSGVMILMDLLNNPNIRQAQISAFNELNSFLNTS